MFAKMGKIKQAHQRIIRVAYSNALNIDVQGYRPNSLTLCCSSQCPCAGYRYDIRSHIVYLFLCFCHTQNEKSSLADGF